jgi:hypothetical protein
MSNQDIFAFKSFDNIIDYDDIPDNDLIPYPSNVVPNLGIYFNLIQKTWQFLAGGELLNSFNDIDLQDQGVLMLELNNVLRDTWQSYDYMFQDRIMTMTCVPGQFSYDMPFDGKLKDKGLLIQQIQTGVTPPRKIEVEFDNRRELYYRNAPVDPTEQALPRKYCFSGNQLLLYPNPDQPYILTCLYESNKWALNVTNVSTYSKSGQNVLNVLSTQEFNTGDIITINGGTVTEETGIIQSIQANVSLTLIGNLTFNHTTNERVTHECHSLVYPDDEPNFSREYHNILIYGALARLFFNDARQPVYVNAMNNAISNMISRSKNSDNGGQSIKITRTDW